MKTIELPLASLIPYEFNNRNHNEQQIDRIANSIKEFGFNQPIVVDESNIVLVGHGRLLAAQKLGLKEVPVLIKKDLSETQKKAYRILDNKLQNDSTWSFDNLDLELGFLEDNEFELEPWGLDELRSLFDVDPEIEDDEFDESECENDETFIKLGDVIELGAHRVMCGDSTSAEDVAELMNGALAQLIVTDPPYGVDYEGGTTAREKLQGDLTPDLYKPVLLLASAYSDEKAAVYLWHSDSQSAAVMEAIHGAGYERRSTIIWNKNLAQFGALSAQYKTKHEPCYYLFKRGNSPRWFGPTNEVTVWDCNRNSRNENHPTEKPVEVMARPIRNSSQRDDLIVDFFLGSGTTLIAADQLNRICYGMEISPKYCHVIIERYKKHCEKSGKKFECKINGEPYHG